MEFFYSRDGRFQDWHNRHLSRNDFEVCNGKFEKYLLQCYIVATFPDVSYMLFIFASFFPTLRSSYCIVQKQTKAIPCQFQAYVLNSSSYDAVSVSSSFKYCYFWKNRIYISLGWIKYLCIKRRRRKAILSEWMSWWFIFMQIVSQAAEKQSVSKKMFQPVLVLNCLFLWQ